MSECHQDGIGVVVRGDQVGGGEGRDAAARCCHHRPPEGGSAYQRPRPRRSSSIAPASVMVARTWRLGRSVGPRVSDMGGYCPGVGGTAGAVLVEPQLGGGNASMLASRPGAPTASRSRSARTASRSTSPAATSPDRSKSWPNHG